MLPWIFGVLILLNAALFYWGHQREATLEPPPAPVPEAQYQIRLLAEMESADSEQPAEQAAPGEVPEAEGVPAPKTIQQDPETGGQDQPATAVEGDQDQDNGQGEPLDEEQGPPLASDTEVLPVEPAVGKTAREIDESVGDATPDPISETAPGLGQEGVLP